MLLKKVKYSPSLCQGDITQSDDGGSICHVSYKIQILPPGVTEAHFTVLHGDNIHAGTRVFQYEIIIIYEEYRVVTHRRQAGDPL